QNVGDISGDETEAAFKSQIKSAKIDLNVVGLEAGKKVVFVYEYSTQLFKEETIGKFFNAFKQLITEVIDNPSQKKIGEMETMSKDEKNKIAKRIQQAEETIYADFDI
ncbi:MAG: hypothetical protein GY757_02545, partial [bacterium]|nr:hypothetical protein [bacterium]